ncbi:MAG: Rab family GTPase [Candidatus Hodarchaeota archaeon]
MQVKNKKVFKIVVLGEAGVGKTSLVRRYCEGTFLEGYKTTIGSDFYVKYLRCEDGSPLILSIWDLAGEHRFQFVMENFMKGAKGALLVFDLTRKRTFIKLGEWLQILQKAAGSVPLILIGNKSDLIDSRFVSADEAKAYAENNGIAYYESSAKTSWNVDNIFQKISNLILSKETTEIVEFKKELHQLDL